MLDVWGFNVWGFNVWGFDIWGFDIWGFDIWVQPACSPAGLETLPFDFIPAVREQLYSEIFGAKMLGVECDVLLLLLLLLLLLTLPLPLPLLHGTCSTILRAAQYLARKCLMFLTALYVLIASANKFQRAECGRLIICTAQHMHGADLE